MDQHVCPPSESWYEYDAQRIPLCRVCAKCRATKLAGYRPEILQGYTQADVDEPIDSEDGDREWDPMLD